MAFFKPLPRFIPILLWAFLAAPALQAQVATVTSEDDDAAASGDLGYAVSVLNYDYGQNNAIGLQTIQFDLSNSPGDNIVQLGETAGGLGAVTLQGPTQFSLQSGAAQPILEGYLGTTGHTNTNGGDSGGVTFLATGSDTAGDPSLELSSGLTLTLGGTQGGPVPLPVDASSGSVTGGAGGGSYVTIGSLLLDTDSALSILGGLGGGVSVNADSPSSEGIEDGYAQGGDGGDVAVSMGAVSLTSSVLDLSSGGGGAVTVEASDGTGINGSGASAGNGGALEAVMGPVELSSSNLGLSAGAGGSIFVDTNNIGIDGGAGRAGNGNDIQVLTGPVTASGSTLDVSGGAGGGITILATLEGAGIITGGAVGGNGGSAFVTLGPVTLSASSLNAVGGAGGTVTVYASTQSTGIGVDGAGGGTGGAVVVSMGPAELSSSSLTVTGGTGGGVGVTVYDSSVGIDGNVVAKSGGAAEVQVSSVTLVSSNLNVAGGAGGSVMVYATDESTGIQGNAQAHSGGSASVSIGSLTMDAASTVAVSGGAAGVVMVQADSTSQGVTGGILNGTAGTSALTAGILYGSGTLTLGGSESYLDVGSGSFAGTITGNESLNVVGPTGALTLTGNNTYTGGTVVITDGTLNIQNDGNVANIGIQLQGGTLQAGSGGLDLSLPVTVTSNNGGFDMNGQDSLLSGQISGAGALTFTDGVGGGALTLTDSNTYTGGTDLQGGTLIAADPWALGTGPLSLQGGTLETDGVNHRIDVGGNFTQGPQATLQLGLGGTVLGQYDQLAVAGSASLAGTLKITSFGGFAPQMGESFFILEAGDGVSGTFGKLEDAVTGSRFVADYLSDGVVLETLPASFAGVGATANQKAVGADLDSLFNNAQEQPLMQSLGALSSAAAYQKAFSQMSPEGFAGLYQAAFNTAFLQSSLVSARLAQWRVGPAGMDSRSAWDFGPSPLYASTLSPTEEQAMGGPGTDGWHAAFEWDYPSFNVAGSSGVEGYSATSGGVLTVDLDKRVAHDLVVGFMVGYGTTQMDLSGNGTLVASGAQGGVYGTWFRNGWYLEGLAQGGYGTDTTQRASYGGVASGSTPAAEYGGLLGGGYEFKSGGWAFGPEVAGQYTRADLDAFSETGSLSPLSLPGQGIDSFLGTAGLRASGSFRLGSVGMTVHASADYEHEFDDLGGQVLAGFGQGDSFTVVGAPLSQDGELISAGLGARLDRDLTLEVDYRGEWGRTNLTASQFGGGLGLSL